MILLGLTGNIACGKSTVAGMLLRRGTVGLDADLLVRELYASAQFAAGLAKLFGASILDAAGAVDRRALGEVVWRDQGAMEQLEAIVHPAVAALREQKLQSLAAGPEAPAVVVVEAVKLIESGQAAGCLQVWWVRCSHQTQLLRLMDARGLSPAEARWRLSKQPGDELKASLMKGCCPGVPLIELWNDGTVDELEHKVTEAWSLLLAKF